MYALLHSVTGHVLKVWSSSKLTANLGLQDSPFQGEEVKRQKATQSASIVTYRLLCPGSRTGSIIGKVIGLVSLHCLTHMLMTWQHTDRVARSYASYGVRLAPRSRLRIQHLSAKTEL